MQEETKEEIKTVIKLDYDVPWDEFDAKKYSNRIEVVKSILGVDLRVFKWEKSKGGNVHVALFSNVWFSDLEVLALQAILGSDWVRECFNLRRIRCGSLNWNILFDGEQ